MTDTTSLPVPTTAHEALSHARFAHDLRIAYHLLLAEGHTAAAHVLTALPNVTNETVRPFGQGPAPIGDQSWTVQHVRELADKALDLLRQLRLQADYDGLLVANVVEEAKANAAASSYTSAVAYVQDACLLAEAENAGAVHVEAARKALADLERAGDVHAPQSYLVAVAATWHACCAVRCARRVARAKIYAELYPELYPEPTTPVTAFAQGMANAPIHVERGEYPPRTVVFSYSKPGQRGVEVVVFDDPDVTFVARTWLLGGTSGPYEARASDFPLHVARGLAERVRYLAQRVGDLAAEHSVAKTRYLAARYHQAGGSDGVEVTRAAKAAAEAHPEVVALRQAYEAAREAERVARAAHETVLATEPDHRASRAFIGLA